MDRAQLQSVIEAAFEARDGVNAQTKGEVRDAVDETLNLLDIGELRVAEKGADGDWTVNQWAKMAVLLSFRLNDMTTIDGGPGGATWWDKVPSKFEGWGDAEFSKAGFRAVPNCVVRRSAHIAPNVVLMPSFVNLGAFVDSGTMVDTWATVGSCAQIGKNVHLSGGAGIGGVLEPKIIALSARVRKLLKAASFAKVRSSVWVYSLANRRRLLTVQQAKSSWGKFRLILLSFLVRCQGRTCRAKITAQAYTVPLS